MVKIFVKKIGYCLQYASDRLKDDQDVVTEAVKQDESNFDLSPRDLETRKMRLLILLA